MRPIVAVSATSRMIQGAERIRLNQAYITSIEQAGMVPLIVPPLEIPSDVHQILNVVHGLILSGGEDVDPAHYGATRHATTGDPNASRDACELELARYARATALPTLAICRGIQLLNVSLGGSLIQDIPSFVDDARVHDGDAPRTARVHDVAVEPGSRLAAVFGAHEIRVNSIHHQALDRVAEGLRITARADDGVIEGVEWTGADWFALGVQWHPEELTGTSEAWDRLLFEAFARACQEYAVDRQPAGHTPP